MRRRLPEAGVRYPLADALFFPHFYGVVVRLVALRALTEFMGYQKRLRRPLPALFLLT